MENFKTIDGITFNTFNVPGNGGSIKMYLILPKNASNPAPVIFDIHGGGFGYNCAAHHYQNAAYLAQIISCAIALPLYRLFAQGTPPCPS